MGGEACLCLHQNCVCRGEGPLRDYYPVLSRAGQCICPVFPRSGTRQESWGGFNRKAFFKQEGLNGNGRILTKKQTVPVTTMRILKRMTAGLRLNKAFQKIADKISIIYFKSCSRNSCRAAIFKSSLSNRISFYGQG